MGDDVPENPFRPPVFPKNPENACHGLVCENCTLAKMPERLTGFLQ
jgi:hypothetical protein